MKEPNEIKTDTARKTFTKISKNEALKTGLNRYYTGNFCAKGHDDQRYAMSGACVSCHREKAKLRMKARRLENARMRDAEEIRQNRELLAGIERDNLLAIEALAQKKSKKVSD
jgi:hypothetical protein